MGLSVSELDNLMTKLSKFEIEGVRETDAPLFSGAPQIPLGDLGERLEKEELPRWPPYTEEPIAEPLPPLRICAYCNNPIEGRCITAMFRKFHPECFVCRYGVIGEMED